MVSMFHKEKAPAITPAPQKSDEQVQEAARREAEMLRRKKGYASTIVTGPEGVTTPATTQKTLLGA
jgi:ribosomal protein S8